MLKIRKEDEAKEREYLIRLSKGTRQTRDTFSSVGKLQEINESSISLLAIAYNANIYIHKRNFP